MQRWELGRHRQGLALRRRPHQLPPALLTRQQQWEAVRMLHARRPGGSAGAGCRTLRQLCPAGVLARQALLGAWVFAAATKGSLLDVV